MPLSLFKTGFVRKAVMATAVAATLGTAALATTQPAEAFWGGPGWHNGFYHHAWGYRGWHRANWGYGYGWHHAYGFRPCLRHVPGPFGWHRIRVC